MNIKLSDLQLGEKATIAGYENTSAQYRERLLSMGLTRGTEITLLKYAPLGDPVEIEIRDFKLSLRKEEAGSLLLNKIPS